jgi:hypothetical protein
VYSTLMHTKLRRKLHIKHPMLTGDTTGLYGNARYLSGDVTGLIGDCTHVVGQCTGVIGDLDSIPRSGVPTWIRIDEYTDDV